MSGGRAFPIVPQVILGMVFMLDLASARGDEPLPFLRVIVPAESVRDVPRGDERYVPLPLTEFDEAVARLGGGSSLRRPGASSAAYSLATDGEGGLTGTVTFTIDGAAGALPSELPLGSASVGRCTVRTPEGSGEAVVYGLPGGRVAVRTSGPGEYSADIRVPAPSLGPRFLLPLLPALMTTVEIELPEKVRPFVVGPHASSVAVEPAGPGRWRFTAGPMESLPLVFRDASAPRPAITAWNTVSLRGHQADTKAIIEPVGFWGPGSLEVSVDPSLRIAGVTADGIGEIPWHFKAPSLTIDLPPALVGATSRVVITAVSPRDTDGPWPIPMIRPLADQWAAAGTRLVVEPTLAVSGVETDQCMVVSDEDAAGWPLASATRPEVAGDSAIGPPSAQLWIEHQSSSAVARAAIGPRTPVFDTARVSIVDISPGTVLGRANCDVRVVSGEAFELIAEIAPGWIIDSVEAVDFTARVAGEPVHPDGGQLDWRVVRSEGASELRIGLARAATPQRSLGLRISGHRVGLPLGAEFSTADLDIVRLAGEASGMALLEFRVGPTAVVETGGTTMGLEPAEGRLEALTGDMPPRARVRTGERSPPVRARLVRRRPPVVADVQLALTAREERLAESFTFTCRPVSGELDAIIIHFSEPLTEGLDWSILDPPGGTLVARPLAMRGGAAASIEEAAALGLSADDQAASGIAESWLVELRPATTGSVTIRASRTVPLESAVPVPLAWVEAAESPGGIVAVRGGRGRRPDIVNRRLRELPPQVDSEDTALVELAYGSPESSASSDGSASADVLPPAATAGARAWAWREATSVWCHESGHVEWQTTIDLENQGRDELAISIPAGLALESVEVASERVAVDHVGGRDGGSVPLPLPARRGRVTLQLRGTAQRDASFGWWSIGSIACGIDVPILDREVRLFLPPGLDLAGQAEFVAEPPGWAERLFRSTERSRGESHSQHAGFRTVHATSVTRGGVAEIVVVRRDVVASLSVLAALAGIFGSFLLARHSGLAAAACCVVLASVALWCDPPWYALPRAAWWGCLFGTWLAGGKRWPMAATSRALVALLVLASISPASAGEGELAPDGDRETLRVFVTPDIDGGIALVPEQLFRKLTTAMSGLPLVRVMSADVGFVPAGGRCSITLDLDADRGGTLVIDQGPSAAIWLPDAHQASPGVVVSYAHGDAEAKLMATVAGRHRVTLVCRPGLTRQGGVTLAGVCVPSAARATLHISGVERPGDKAASLQCERSDSGDEWVPAPRSGDTTFDVAGAQRVRIIRPFDVRDRLANEFRSAESTNDIDWLPHECRVSATFDIGGEREIVRSLVVRADPDLEPIAVDGEPQARRLGSGRWLLERPDPRAGAARVSVTFRRDLPEPVGVFTPPEAWLEAVASDRRTIRLRPAPMLDASVELPLGMALVRPRPEDGPTTTAVWRMDVVPAVADSLTDPVPSAVRLMVRRAAAAVRGSQELSVRFDENGVGLRLRSTLEALAVPLVEIPVELPPAAIVDRVSVVREPSAEAASAKPDSVDVAWSRVAAGRIVVTAQRPQTGKFRLELDARQPIRPAERGRMPVARVVTGGDLPLSITCQASPPLVVTLVGDPGETMPSLADRFDLASDEPAPNYELARQTKVEQGSESDPTTESGTHVAQARVELTRIDLAFDRRGRCHGLVRFDLVASQPVLSLELPIGMRLLDVRVDGREVTATPGEGTAWDVRLHDVSWPRTLVAVVSGAVGGRFADGEPILLEAPRIEHLQSGPVLWCLETPPGFRIRVSKPSRVVGEPEWRAREGTRQGVQQEAFAAAIAAGPTGDVERLRSFARARQEGTMPAGEREWYVAWQSAREAEPIRTRIVAGEDGTVTLRAVPVVPVSVAGRGLATGLLVTLVLGVWHLLRRFPTVEQMLLPVVHRWWWGACGIAWVFLLEPALPGWCLVAAGAWIAWPQSWRWWLSPATKVHDSAANASTRAVIPN